VGISMEKTLLLQFFHQIDDAVNYPIVFQ
jgi:hypothetical protein